METPKISNTSEINDVRGPPQFKGVSFSNYKRTDVRNQLIENIKNGKLEPAAYWCAELVCAGHFQEIWEIVLHYAGKHIHLGNPKIIIYLQMRYEIFRNIMAKGEYLVEHDLRNNATIRRLFAEVVSVLALSPRKHSFEPIKISRESEFDITNMSDRLKAPTVEYVAEIMRPRDPKEIFIPVNEFSYHLSQDSRSTIEACYWIEWVIEFDAICKKRKVECSCDRRTVPVENRFQKDIIWILWDAVKHYVDLTQNPFIQKLYDALLQIFCIKYTTAACKKRRYLLYFAVALLTEDVKGDIELIPQKNVVQNVVDKINIIYAQVKKSGEQSPGTDYLFAGIRDDKENFEKSMRKMALVNELTLF